MKQLIKIFKSLDDAWIFYEKMNANKKVINEPILGIKKHKDKITGKLESNFVVITNFK